MKTLENPERTNQTWNCSNSIGDASEHYKKPDSDWINVFSIHRPFYRCYFKNNQCLTVTQNAFYCSLRE